MSIATALLPREPLKEPFPPTATDAVGHGSFHRPASILVAILQHACTTIESPMTSTNHKPMTKKKNAAISHSAEGASRGGLEAPRTGLYSIKKWPPIRTIILSYLHNSQPAHDHVGFSLIPKDGIIVGKKSKENLKGGWHHDHQRGCSLLGFRSS
jgi:hypothetical protein